MITIQLAAYNGSAYISEQIQSILDQTVQDFTIIVRDDCSTDDTPSIVGGYAALYPGKVVLRQNKFNSGSAKNNFFKMMTETRDSYLMLCDHDDVWLPDKIELSLAAMREMESLYGSDIPLLVYTDLRVVDDRLNTVSPSFERFMNADFTRTELGSLLIQNTVTGCAAMYNRALAELLHREPQYAAIHDWWLALVAALFGKLMYLPETTVLYRQHGGNEIGAKNARSFSYITGRLGDSRRIRESIAQTYLQAGSLLELYRDRLSTDQAAFLKAYHAIPSLGKLERLRSVRRLKAFKYGFSRNVAYLFFL